MNQLNYLKSLITKMSNRVHRFYKQSGCRERVFTRERE